MNTDPQDLSRYAGEIAAEIRRGNRVPEAIFDQHLPDDLNQASDMFWTPLEVTSTVGAWLTEIGARSVLDIGSGVGKFCIAGALTTGCTFFGIEQRPRLVTIAQRLAPRFGVQARVSFITGRFGDVCIAGVDAVYLYNPFGENLCLEGEALDDTVLLDRARYRHDVALVERFLDALPAGVHVVTYNGFGGRIPTAFSEVCIDHSLPNVLQMWRKEAGLEVPRRE